MDRIFALVYRELRVLAHRQLGRGRTSETLSTTALVHEVYLKLAHNRGAAPNDRGHFFAVAARAMRQIVVDYARRRGAEKRGGGVRPEVLDDERMGFAAQVEEVLAVDTALTRLEALDARLGRLVELRFFAGLSVEETAEALSTSERTVKRDWRKARAFLARELGA
jgi:RNA polymerase sigma factor (TIGR02999 family)